MLYIVRPMKKDFLHSGWKLGRGTWTKLGRSDPKAPQEFLPVPSNITIQPGIYKLYYSLKSLFSRARYVKTFWNRNYGGKNGKTVYFTDKYYTDNKHIQWLHIYIHTLCVFQKRVQWVDFLLQRTSWEAVACWRRRSLRTRWSKASPATWRCVTSSSTSPYVVRPIAPFDRYIIPASIKAWKWGGVWFASQPPE